LSQTFPALKGGGIVLLGTLTTLNIHFVVLEQLRWHPHAGHLNNLAANLRRIHTDRYIPSSPDVSPKLSNSSD